MAGALYMLGPAHLVYCTVWHANACLNLQLSRLSPGSTPPPGARKSHGTGCQAGLKRVHCLPAAARLHPAGPAGSQKAAPTGWRRWCTGTAAPLRSTCSTPIQHVSGAAMQKMHHMLAGVLTAVLLKRELCRPCWVLHDQAGYHYAHAAQLLVAASRRRTDISSAAPLLPT